MVFDNSMVDSSMVDSSMVEDRKLGTDRNKGNEDIYVF